jgi:hypothetical protein
MFYIINKKNLKMSLLEAKDFVVKRQI